MHVATSIPIMQLRDNAVCVYQEPLFRRKHGNNLQARLRMARARLGDPNAQDGKPATYSGRLTDGARKRLMQAITLLCQASRPRWVRNPQTGTYQYHRLSFITLTVSSTKNLTARKAYQLLLAPFLDWLRKTEKVTTYIWKAELQRRGQIHYHITTPAFIPWERIRATWNRLQHAAGLLDEYAKKHGHFNPNSTDIHETRGVKNMASYLAKELAKNINATRNHARKMVDSLIQAGEIPADKREQFIDEYTGQELKTDGKIWDCSNNLAGIKYYAVPLSYDQEKILTQLKKANQVRVISGDFWEVIYFSDGSPPDLLSNDQRYEFEKYLQDILTDKETDLNTEPLIVDETVMCEQPDKTETLTWQQMQLFLN